MADLNFDKLAIDRVVDGYFEDSDLKLLCVVDDIQNFSISNTSETKDKLDSQGTLIKRWFTSKSSEVSAENAVFSMNLAAIQMGTVKKKGTEVVMPRIMQVAKTDSPITLPEVPIDGTLIVYGTHENGVVDTDIRYTKDATAGENTYAYAVSEGTATLTLPTNATDTVQIKYERTVGEDTMAARVDQDSSRFPKECKATFRALVYDVCKADEAFMLYIVFPRFQMSPDFDFGVDTDSTQALNGIALRDYCSRTNGLYYLAVAEDTNDYDVKQYVTD